MPMMPDDIPENGVNPESSEVPLNVEGTVRAEAHEEEITAQPETPATPPNAAEEDEGLEDEEKYPGNATEEFPCKSPLKPNSVAASIYDSISVLYTSTKGAEYALARVNDAQLSNPAESLDWVQATTQSDLTAAVPDPIAFHAQWREGSQWGQNVKTASGTLGVGSPRLDDSLTGNVLSGDAAIRSIQARLGMGTHVQYPLWNSGFWVTIVPPQESALLNLDRKLQMEKIKLGRDTRGAVFDNYRIYVLKSVLDMIFQHIDKTTLAYGAEGMEEAIKSKLLITDIPNLILGMLTAMYPNGHPLVQPCTADITKCTHVTHELLNLTKIQWIDSTRLNDRQRKHMTKRKTGSMRLVEVEEYQNEFPSGSTSLVELENDLEIVLKVPTLAEYEDSGTRWVDGLDQDTVNVFGSNLSGVERENHLYQQARLQTLRSMSHWYKQITILPGHDNEKIITDMATLEESSIALSSNLGSVDLIEAGVRKFQEDMTCTVIGIVNYTCPACGKTQLSPNAPNQVIIPMDIVSTFFTLLSSRLTRMLRR